MTIPKAARLRSPSALLLLMTVISAGSFALWHALLNNFAVEAAQFTGAEIGILQSLREIPGFLSFTAVFLLLIITEQRFALVSLLLLGAGVALTGVFPSVLGLYCTTVLMSIGFHYFETLSSSLTLQWTPKEHTAAFLGKLVAARSFASLAVFVLLWLALEWAQVAYVWLYLIVGGGAIVVTLLLWFGFPQFKQAVPQHKKIILRSRYWLYYLLTFMSGARRQIFIVFAGFLMVEKFGYSAADITLLYLINHLLSLFLAPRIGALVGKIGERRALTLEYIGLVVVFSGYAFVSNAYVAAGLYVIDHVFFALAIAIKTYFQKIADPQDIAATASVSFTISHIAAVFIPALFGLIWLQSPALVFLFGAAMAGVSLLLSRLIPDEPMAGQEIRPWGWATVARYGA